MSSSFQTRKPPAVPDQTKPIYHEPDMDTKTTDFSSGSYSQKEPPAAPKIPEPPHFASRADSVNPSSRSGQPSSSVSSRSASAASRSSFSSTRHPSFAQRYTPAVALITCMAMFFAGFVGTVITADSGGSVTVTPDPIMGTAVQSDGLKYEQMEPYVLENRIYVPYHISKKDPYSFVFSTIEVDAENIFDDDIEDTEYLSFNMDFFTTDVWVTAVFDFYNEVSPDVSDYTFELSEEYYDTIPLSDYDFLSDEDHLNNLDLLKLYKKEYGKFQPTVTVDPDSVKARNGVITFTVEYPKTTGQSSQVNGQVNVILRKNGKVVFGGIYDYSGSLSGGKKSFAYTPEVPLPDYDSVEVVPISH